MKLETALAILQQSEYHWQYFSDWYQSHHEQSPEIHPQQWTTKLKIIQLISIVLFFLPLFLRIRIALSITQLAETPIRYLLLLRAKRKLRHLQLQGLTVVAIAGSFGKTSTKHIMSHLLSRELKTVITQKSINTPLGIAQTVQNQLTAETSLFIVELGEYYPGDIKRLANFVQPDYGIMTPLGEQHLERMNTVEAIAATIGELTEYFDSQPQNILIHESYNQYLSRNHVYYGTTDVARLKVKSSSISRSGTEFTIALRDESFSGFTPLYGEHQVVNILPSIWLAKQLDLPIKTLVQQCATIPYISRRHEPHFGSHNTLTLDNSYNTNPQSFQASLKLLSQLESDRTIVITMGFVELGAKNDERHYQLGAELAKNVDYVAVLPSRWNAEIMHGFISEGGNPNHIITASTIETALTQLHDRIIPNTIILLEGGYQELYT